MPKPSPRSTRSKKQTKRARSKPKANRTRKQRGGMLKLNLPFFRKQKDKKAEKNRLKRTLPFNPENYKQPLSNNIYDNKYTITVSPTSKYLYDYINNLYTYRAFYSDRNIIIQYVYTSSNINNIKNNTYMNTYLKKFIIHSITKCNNNYIIDIKYLNNETKLNNTSYEAYNILPHDAYNELMNLMNLMNLRYEAENAPSNASSNA